MHTESDTEAARSPSAERQTPTGGSSCDHAELAEAREQLERANPELAESYVEFLKSFAKFREVEARFKGRKSAAARAPVGTRLSA